MNTQKKIADSAVCCKNLKTIDIPFLYWKALEPLIGDRPIQMASQLLMKLQQIRAAEEIEAIKRAAILIERVISRASQIFKAAITEQEDET